MRFSTVAILATGALASTIPEAKPQQPHGHGKKVTTSTVYATIVKTLSSCPPEVTKCPYDKTKIVTETVSSFTTVCTVDDDDDDTYTKKPTVTHTGKPEPPKTTTPCDDDDITKYHPGKPTGKPDYPDHDHPGKPKPEEPECKPVTKVKTITSRSLQSARTPHSSDEGGHGIKPMNLNRKRPLALYGVFQVDR
jgi:hypothetical protein